MEAVVRGVEVGILLADRDPETHENRYPKLEFLRLAIPRRTYTNSDLDVVIEALKNIYDICDEIRTGLRITKEAQIMRHFTVHLDKIQKRNSSFVWLILRFQKAPENRSRP